MSPIVTVVIPVYNGEKYVGRAVESVIYQPEKEAVEILVVNDGSTDESGRICDELAEKYTNVHVLHKENGGVSTARNLGIQNVETKYVAFLDCDDWWDPDFLDASLVAEFSGKCSADVYQFAYQKMDKYYCLVKCHPVKNEELRYSESGLGRYDWAHPCSYFYSTALLKEHQIAYPIAKVGEDGPFVEMALFHAKKFKRINKTAFIYWENMQSCLHTTKILTEYKGTL